MTCAPTQGHTLTQMTTRHIRQRPRSQETHRFHVLRRQHRKLVAEHHPDRMMARGVPAEFIAIANERLAAINAAWATIEARHRPRAPEPA